MSGIVKDTIVLFIITLVSGTALGGVHELTLEPIAIANEKAANETYREVFAEAESFAEAEEAAQKAEEANAEAGSWGYGKVHIDNVLEAKDASGQIVGHVINVTSKEGYNGEVQVAVGINGDSRLTGIGFLSIAETPGLGMRAKEPAFRDQFAGKDASGELTMIKTGTATDQQFDAISGASFTSGAVSGCINTAIRFVNNYLE